MADATLHWLECRDITRDQLYALILAALDGILTGVDAIEPGLRLSTAVPRSTSGASSG